LRECRNFPVSVPKKMEDAENSLTENKVAPAEPDASPQTGEQAETGELENELNEARWAVIGANDRTVRHLTYEQAVECLSVLDSEGIFGLCIVTDETAERLLSYQGQA
jgi:hypothetical protein